MQVRLLCPLFFSDRVAELRDYQTRTPMEELEMARILGPSAVSCTWHNRNKLEFR